MSDPYASVSHNERILMNKSFKSLEELKQFVISEKIANFEKQKQAEQALLNSLKGNK
jgi:hypothetical protein